MVATPTSPRLTGMAVYTGYPWLSQVIRWEVEGATLIGWRPWRSIRTAGFAGCRFSTRQVRSFPPGSKWPRVSSRRWVVGWP